MAVIKSGNSTDELIVDNDGAAYAKILNADGSIVDFETLTNTVSTANSSTVILTAGSTFVGTAVDVSAFNSVVAAVYTDQVGSLYIEFSTDGTNWDSSVSYSVEANTNEIHRLSVSRKYCRIRFQNTSSSAQTFFRLQTMFGSFTQFSSALNSTIQQDGDALVVRSVDSEIDIAAGKYAGFSIVNKFGYLLDVDVATVPEDVWEVGGAYTGFPTTGDTVTVVSTSANDTIAGTGARTIRITGLDSNYNTQTEDFSLNGVGAVTGVKTFTRVHSMFTLTSGGSNANFNAGTITAYQTATPANIFLSMRPSSNQTNSSGYTVPAGYTGYIRRIHAAVNASSATTTAVDFSIWSQSADKTNSPRLRRPNTAYFGVDCEDVIFGGVQFTEKSDIILRVTACSQNNTGFSAGYDLILVKN